jgi:hypothetical protein
MKGLLLFIAMTLVYSTTASAETLVIKRSEGYTANCTNPVERVDGTALLASEIASVWYYLDPVHGANGGTPQHSVLMSGGCKPSFIDTKQIPKGVYYRFAVAVDTDGLISDVSTMNAITITLQNARPKSASNVE